MSAPVRVAGIRYADGHMRCRRCDYAWMPRVEMVKKCPRCYYRLDIPISDHRLKSLSRATGSP
jgi:hypothetical protein